MNAKDPSPCVREAIITHWIFEHPYSKIMSLINHSKIAKQNSKSTIWYNFKRLKETNSCDLRIRKGQNWSVRTSRLMRSVHEKTKTPKRSICEFGQDP